MQAQHVTLSSPNGSLRIEGRVVGFDGTYLRLQTPQGVVTMSYDPARCEGFACPDGMTDAPVLRFAGAGRVGSLILPALADGFAASRGLDIRRYDFGAETTAFAFVDDAGVPALNFVFQATSTGEGLGEMLAFATDILVADRALREDELRQAARSGLGALADRTQMRLVALDAFVPVISPQVAVPGLTMAQVSDIFTGDLTNWAAVGGQDAPIERHLVSPHGETVIETRLLAPQGRSISPEVIIHPDHDSLRQAVADAPGAIGIVPHDATGGVQVPPLRDSCGTPLVPDLSTIKTEDYPLVEPVYFYVPRYRLPPVAEEFLDWISTPQAEVVLRAAGVISQEPVPISMQQQGARLASAVEAAGPDVSLADLQDMLTALHGLARLSLTFRFDDGEQALDVTSALHVEYLAQRIAQGVFDGRRLVLVGFSDGVGAASVNLTLSRARAVEVRSAVIEALGGALSDGVTLDAIGMGEALPIGCDATVWGRRVNRRVEIWSGPAE